MSGWPTVRLEDCAEIVSGATPSTSESAYWDGDVCWATPKDLSELEGAYISDTPRKITRSGLQSCAATVLPPDSVLFSSRAPIGHVAINTVPMATNQGFKSFVPNGERVHAKFLYHWLRRNRPYLESLGNGATFKEVSKAVVARIEIPLPPLPEQLRIAEILDKADALRAKRRAAVAQLDTLTQSIFLDMFGDPATNPKGWARPSLAELLNGAEVFVDGDWVESKDQDPEGEVRLIQLADVGDGVYLDKSARFLTKQTALRLKCTPLKMGDVLVARMPDPLGRACTFPGDEREAVTVVDVCIIRPATEGPHPVWLMCCINTSAFRSQIAREATGTTRERISRGNLAKLRVISPPRELQESFVRQYQTVSDLRARQCASLEELDGLFASLQHRAFRGEL
ncbi:MAG: restriction endonuclease subunit S [Burkholderiaceae bacterium]|jgi:type I restriction enzyme S subunit|nr:restriction endonuclease subunit S [Burkholderiaceae bacterium]MEB2351787.1 restriction endonuclease subunit S [Burkholderiaceae bacterium]